MEKLDAVKVHELFLSLLFQDVADANDDNMIIVEGIMNKYGLQKKQVEANKERIKALVEELNDNFRNSVGGGFSFLNMCYDKHGNQWAGSHRTMEQLLVMGMAIDYMAYCIPRDAWKVLPGGMPYVVIKDGPTIKDTEQST